MTNPSAPIPVDAEPLDQASPEARRALTMVRQLSGQLDMRLADILKWQRYYDGEQPLLFATDEYRKYFGKQYAGFRDNWCAPVCDTLAEKLTGAGLKIPHSAADAAGGAMEPDRDFARVWAMNECDSQSSEAFIEGAIARRSFAMAWGNDDDPETPMISFESPDEVIVGYEPGNRRIRKAALKQWRDADYDFATLYTPTALYKWQRRRPPNGDKLYVPDRDRYYDWLPRSLPSGDSWVLPNPSGVVPIIELPNRPRLRSEPLSEIAGVAAMQDAINLLWSYLFTSSDFAALPQRVVLGAQQPKIPILDADGQPTGSFKALDPDAWMKAAATRRIMSFEGENAKIAQWDPADLAAFTKTIEFAVGHVAAQSRTPAHYFVTGHISNISGDGLIALAQAHISKARERSVYLGVGMRELAAVQYLMRGKKAAAQAARLGKFEWREFEQQSKSQLGDWAGKMRTAGFSFEWIASQVITDPVELADEVERFELDQRRKAATLEFGPKPPALTGPPVDDTSAG